MHLKLHLKLHQLLSLLLLLKLHLLLSLKLLFGGPNERRNEGVLLGGEPYSLCVFRRNESAE